MKVLIPSALRSYTEAAEAEASGEAAETAEDAG